MIDIQKYYPEMEPIICYSALSEEFVDNVTNAGDRLQFMEGKIGTKAAGEYNPSVRESLVSWIPADDEHLWIWQKLSEITSSVNHDKYNFDLVRVTGFQYTTYTEGGFYNWHVDGAFERRSFGPSMRKLGFSLLLSEPEEDFTGGEFQIIPGGNPEHVLTQALKKGDILAFPSFIPHRVSTILTGKRKSLVWWAEGPNFK